jgi:hypothetical protein
MCDGWNGILLVINIAACKHILPSYLINQFSIKLGIVSTCIYLSPSLSARPVLPSPLLPNPHRAVTFNTRDCTRCMDAPQPLVAHSKAPFSFTPIERYSKAQGLGVYLQLPNRFDLTGFSSPTHSIYQHLPTLLHHFNLSVARPFIPLSAFPFGFLRRSACRFLTPCPNTRSQIRALRALNSYA